MAAIPEHRIQDQDVQICIRGMNAPVYVDAALAKDGWKGGQWVYYTATVASGTLNVRVVSKSVGTLVAGFMARPSEFHPAAFLKPDHKLYNPSEYNYSSQQPRVTQVVTMYIDGSYLFKHFEKFAFPNRTSGAALVYTLNQTVYLSERGLITTLADATAAGIATPVVAGVVWAAPVTANGNRLGIDRF